MGRGRSCDNNNVVSSSDSFLWGGAYQLEIIIDKRHPGEKGLGNGTMG